MNQNSQFSLEIMTNKVKYWRWRLSVASGHSVIRLYAWQWSDKPGLVGENRNKLNYNTCYSHVIVKTQTKQTKKHLKWPSMEKNVFCTQCSYMIYQQGRTRHTLTSRSKPQSYWHKLPFVTASPRDNNPIFPNVISLSICIIYLQSSHCLSISSTFSLSLSAEIASPFPHWFWLWPSCNLL